MGTVVMATIKELQARMKALTDEAMFSEPNFPAMIAVLREAMKLDNANGNDRVKQQMCVDTLVGSANFLNNAGEQTKCFIEWTITMIELGYHGWPALPKKKQAA